MMLGMGKVPPPWGETLPSRGGSGELSGIHITKMGNQLEALRVSQALKIV